MKNLIKQVQNNAFGKGLWEKNSKIVLGVSGGPDSVCMLDIFSKLAKKYNLSLIIAHVNYHLREKDSDKDEQFVTRLAKKYNLPLAITHWSGKKVTEENLRDFRYIFFETIRQENNFDSIAVAHNKNDQAETYLMRTIRGAGILGLSSMRWKNVYPVKSSLQRSVINSEQFNAGAIIRPLLGTSRKEILAYLKEKKLKYRTDKTNMTNAFLRNRIRNTLIPFLEKNFNSKIVDILFNATETINDDYLFLENTAKELMPKITDEISARYILSLDNSMQRMLLRKILSDYKGDRLDIDSQHIAEILKMLRSEKGKQQTFLFQGLKLTKNGDKVVISHI